MAKTTAKRQVAVKPVAKERAVKKSPVKREVKAAAPTPVAKTRTATTPEEAGDEMMALIDAHRFGTSKVSRRDSAEYYQYLVTECQGRQETIEEELEDEDESGEGDDGDDSEDTGE